MAPEIQLATKQLGDDASRSYMEQDAHILIVDDDEQLRQLVTKLLRSQGLRATAVGTGREMLETLRAADIDLIVLDVMLQGVSGLDLCRQVRQTSSLPAH